MNKDLSKRQIQKRYFWVFARFHTLFGTTEGGEGCDTSTTPVAMHLIINYAIISSFTQEIAISRYTHECLKQIDYLFTHVSIAMNLRQKSPHIPLYF